MSFEMQKVKHLLKNWYNMSCARFGHNIDLKNLWNNTPNPYDEKLRGARQDLSHSYVDLFVELIRATAYLQGHVIALLVIVLPIMVVWQ